MTKIVEVQINHARAVPQAFPSLPQGVAGQIQNVLRLWLKAEQDQQRLAGQRYYPWVACFRFWDRQYALWPVNMAPLHTDQLSASKACLNRELHR